MDSWLFVLYEQRCLLPRYGRNKTEVLIYFVDKDNQPTAGIGRLHHVFRCHDS